MKGGRKCLTELHGGVYCQTLTQHKSENERKKKETTVCTHRNDVLLYNVIHLSVHTCVLNTACMLRLIRNISLTVSSLPCFISNSFHVCQNGAVL